MVAKVPGNHDIGQALFTYSQPRWSRGAQGCSLLPGLWRFQLPTSWICIVPDGVREPQENRSEGGDSLKDVLGTFGGFLKDVDSDKVGLTINGSKVSVANCYF